MIDPTYKEWLEAEDRVEAYYNRTAAKPYRSVVEAAFDLSRPHSQPSDDTPGQALYEQWCDPDEGLERYWHFLSVMEQDRWERLAESVRTAIQMVELAAYPLQHISVKEDDEELIVVQPEWKW
jgi:hypothetical protein